MDAKQVRNALLGAMLMGLGVAFLAAQMGWSWAPEFRRLWPLVFLLLAIAHIGSTRGLVQPMPIYFVCLTTIFLLHTHRVLVLRDSWPLFIVAGGLLVLTGDLAQQAHRRRRAARRGKELR